MIRPSRELGVRSFRESTDGRRYGAVDARAPMSTAWQSQLLLLPLLRPFDRARPLLRMRMEKFLSDFQRFGKRHYKFIWNIDRFARITFSNRKSRPLLWIQIHFPAKRHVPSL